MIVLAALYLALMVLFFPEASISYYTNRDPVTPTAASWLANCIPHRLE